MSIRTSQQLLSLTLLGVVAMSCRGTGNVTLPTEPLPELSASVPVADASRPGAPSAVVPSLGSVPPLETVIGASPTPTDRSTATATLATTESSPPETDPFVGTTEGVRMHLFAEVIERTRDSYCVNQLNIDFDLEAVQADLEDLASRAGPESGLLAGRYFIGPLDRGIAAFGGEEVLAREGEDGAVWFGKSPDPGELRASHDRAEFAAFRFVPLALSSGEGAWWRTGEYIAGGPCPPPE